MEKLLADTDRGKKKIIKKDTEHVSVFFKQWAEVRRLPAADTEFVMTDISFLLKQK
jgi:hypothetical protein